MSPERSSLRGKAAGESREVQMIAANVDFVIVVQWEREREREPPALSKSELELGLKLELKL